ncbi:16414_t:CDS:2, partial [Funneliformis mosseae]
KNRVNVIGAGVVGLTTGLVLQKNGYKVKIIAEHWPGDLSNNYTSPCAGAIFSPHEFFDERFEKIQNVSYKTLWALSNMNDTGVIRLPNFMFHEKNPHIDVEKLFKGVYHEFHILPKNELPKNVDYGISFTTVTIDVPIYLRWLLNQFTSAGGVTQKAHLNHLNDADEPNVDFVINCTGVNARNFGGVDDDKVFPTRGQIVVVSAPHIKFAKSLQEEDGTYTYIIPRECGEVILGGTMDVNNYDTTPDPKTAESILNRCIKLCPELTQDKDLSSVHILRHVVGLRPSRKGGIRLETEVRRNSVGKDVIICHNYGHHSYGYIMSWGSAIEVLDLIKSVKSQKEARL